MSMLGMDLENFVTELDAAMQAHLEWTRKVLRCAVLQASPGEDVLNSEAHHVCQFGRWFLSHRAQFEALDAGRAHVLENEHQAMHDAIRSICRAVLEGKPGTTEDLDRFEAAQHHLVDNLAYFKTSAVSRSSQIDPLTGLPLRHRMEQDFDLLNKHIRRHGTVQAVMLVDVDHFKTVNDTFGHAAGDAVLRSLAACLRSAIRDDDLVYRYGGEEFLLLMELPARDHFEELAAQRLLDAVRNLAVDLQAGKKVSPTVTIGVALAKEDESMDSTIRRADEALYRGKLSGRDRYVLAN